MSWASVGAQRLKVDRRESCSWFCQDSSSRHLYGSIPGIQAQLAGHAGVESAGMLLPASGAGVSTPASWVDPRSRLHPPVAKAPSSQAPFFIGETSFGAPLSSSRVADNSGLADGSTSRPPASESSGLGPVAMVAVRRCWSRESTLSLFCAICRQECQDRVGSVKGRIERSSLLGRIRPGPTGKSSYSTRRPAADRARAAVSQLRMLLDGSPARTRYAPTSAAASASPWGTPYASSRLNGSILGHGCVAEPPVFILPPRTMSRADSVRRESAKIIRTCVRSADKRFFSYGEGTTGS